MSCQYELVHLFSTWFQRLPRKASICEESALQRREHNLEEDRDKHDIVPATHHRMVKFNDQIRRALESCLRLNTSTKSERKELIMKRSCEPVPTANGGSKSCSQLRRSAHAQVGVNQAASNSSTQNCGTAPPKRWLGIDWTRLRRIQNAGLLASPSNLGCLRFGGFIVHQPGRGC